MQLRRLKPNPKRLRVAGLVILSIGLVFLILSTVFPFPEGAWDFLSIGTSQKALANPDWLPGYSYRANITISEDGGGAKSDYAIPLDVYANSAPLADDAINEWFCHPAFYYDGTYERAYIGYYTSAYDIKLNYYDVDTEAWSGPITLWSDWGWDSSGSAKGDDHAAPSVIVLQYQTGDNSVHNGKILVSAAEHGAGVANKGRLETRRSTYSEFSNNGTPNTSFDSAVSVRTTNSSYSQLAELSDGTIFLFSRLTGEASRSLATWFGWTSTDAGASWSAYNSGACIWDAPIGATDGYLAIEYPNADGSGIHFIINPYNYTENRYADIYYLFYKQSDGKWYHADGTTEFTLGSSHATADLVYETDDTEDEEDWTWCWDVKSDSQGNPYLVFVNNADAGVPIGADETGDVYRANYSGGSWVVESVATTGQMGTYVYPAGAVLDPIDMDVVYSTPYKSETTANTEFKKYERISGNWTKTADIFESGGGDFFRPLAVWHTPEGNDLRVICHYTEYYTEYSPGSWSSQVFGYPGVSLDTFLQLGGTARSDFGDIRFTTSDGTTLQPSASSGKPWIQSQTEGFSAKLWIKVGNVPASGSIDIYMYWGNSEATNANDQDVMDAQFYLADHFDSSLDTDKWTLVQGDVGMSSSNLVLTGTAGTRGLIQQNTANYANVGPDEEFQLSMVCSATTANLVSVGLRNTDWTDIVRFYTGTGDKMFTQTLKDGSATATEKTSMGINALHIWSAKWHSASALFYRDGSLLATHSTNIPADSIGLHAYEGNAVGVTTSVDWIFLRPCTNPEPAVSWENTEVETAEIANTPDNYGFGILEVGSTANTAINYFTLNNTGNCPVDVVIYGTDATGGDDTWTLSNTATPGENIYGLKAGLDDDDDTFDIIVRKSETYNTLVSGLAESATQDWGVEIYMPTSLSGYDNNEMTATITLVASESS